MTASRAPRQAATAVAVAVALGTAGAAMAKPIDVSSVGSSRPAPYVSAPSRPATPHTTAGGSGWAYVAIGSGAVGVTVVGATLAAGQSRDRKDAHARKRGAA